jgi:hypothetical protein
MKTKTIEEINDKIETIKEVIDAYRETDAQEKAFKDRIEIITNDNYKKVIKSMFDEESFYIKSAENVGILIGYETYLKEYGKNSEIKKIVKDFHNHITELSDSLLPHDDLLKSIVSSDDSFSILKNSDNLNELVKVLYMMRFASLVELSRYKGALKAIAYCVGQLDEEKTLF